MSYSFRIAKANPLIIEWQADLPGAVYGFYMVCDSPNEAKRILSVLMPSQQPTLLGDPA